jgi:hypothetical protein
VKSAILLFQGSEENRRIPEGVQSGSSTRYKRKESQAEGLGFLFLRIKSKSWGIVGTEQPDQLQEKN